MLVLTRKLNETIVIDGSISVTVVAIRGNQVRLGIRAPRELGIYRSELCERTAAGKNSGSMSPPEVEHAVN
jgi:carbon storage regulator